MSAGGTSQRSVLPEFDIAEWEGSTLLVAPLQRDLIELEGLRVAPSASSQLQKRLDIDDEKLALSAELAMLARQTAEDEFLGRGQDVSVVVPSIENYAAFATDPKRFFHLTIDGSKFYLVPKRQHLPSTVEQADYSLAFGKLIFSVAISQTSFRNANGQLQTRMTRLIELETRFVVWDYISERIVVEGKVSSSVDLEEELDQESWTALMEKAVEEILSERPFAR